MKITALSLELCVVQIKTRQLEGRTGWGECARQREDDYPFASEEVFGSYINELPVAAKLESDVRDLCHYQ